MREDIQEQLLKLAATSTWSKRVELHNQEDELAENYWISVFDKELKDKEKRYLALTSLPFVIQSDELQDLLICETVLKKLWEIDLCDIENPEYDIVLPTGNMRPTYFIIGDRSILHERRSFVSNGYLRRALLVAGIYYECWFTHIVKSVDPKMPDLEKQFKYIEREIKLLQPQYLIVLGSKTRETILPVEIPDPVAIITVTEPEYMFKTKHPYEEYGEGIKTAIAYYKEENTNAS